MKRDNKLMRKAPLICLVFFLSSTSWAAPSKIGWELWPVQPNPLHYENKEYKTNDEYIKALQEGKCSSTWVWMHMGHEDKVSMINDLKNGFKEKNHVIINKPAEFYVKLIDDMIASNANMQYQRMGIIFKALAIVSYDFDEGKGISKDETARKWLGKEDYQRLKRTAHE